MARSFELNSLVVATTDKCEYLEHYLHDLHDKKLEFKVDKDELKFIKDGIETLVMTIVQKLKKLPRVVYDEIQKFQKIYFEFERVESEQDFIKAGSIYEKTKNVYPNTFDFVFVIETFRNDQEAFEKRTDKSVCYDFKDIHRIIKKLCVDNRKQLTFERDLNKIIFFGYVGVHGPASKLTFCYHNRKTRIICFIHVDLVPVFRLVNIDQQFVKRNCAFEPFVKEVVATGSVLVVKTVSFTETEVHFMVNVLSMTHSKVYKLLKYLVGGHRFEKSGKCQGYSSYMIKTAVIMHHYNCSSDDQTKLGPCLLSLLHSLVEYLANGNDAFPTLINGKKIDNTRLIDNKLTITKVKQIIQDLTCIQRSKYAYRNIKVRPVEKEWVAVFKMETKGIFYVRYTHAIICAVICVGLFVMIMFSIASKHINN